MEGVGRRFETSSLVSPGKLEGSSQSNCLGPSLDCLLLCHSELDATIERGLVGVTILIGKQIISTVSPNISSSEDVFSSE